MKLFKLAVFLFFISTVQLYAQSYGNFKKVPVAFGLFPPLNTNGTDAGNCVNQLSFNLISGYSGGLAGFEFAGFSNTERDFVRGAQFAGFLNFVNGEFTGFQYAGFANFNRDIARGFQFAGFANFNYAEANGMLFSGFANFTNGKSLAIQMAGFANFCEDVEGFQASGFANVVKGNGKVTQLSGFSNIILGEANGFQAAGFLNYSKEKMQKFQAAGFTNIVNSDAEGVQIAGFSNITKGNLNGVQIAGFMNVAKKLNGLQLGFINFADSVESGVPLGFLSFVRKGFHEFEFSVGETFNTQVALKIGVEKFYNIFAFGTQFLTSGFNWGFGYGIGTHLAHTDNFKTQLELVSYQIKEGNDWIDTYNGLQQLKLTFSKKITNHVDAFAGPAFNLLVTNNKFTDGGRFESHFAPYSFFTHKGDDTTLKGWIGITAGIKIN